MKKNPDITMIQRKSFQGLCLLLTSQTQCYTDTLQGWAQRGELALLLHPMSVPFKWWESIIINSVVTPTPCALRKTWAIQDDPGQWWLLGWWTLREITTPKALISNIFFVSIWKINGSATWNYIVSICSFWGISFIWRHKVAEKGSKELKHLPATYF